EGNITVMQRLNNIERLLKDQQKPEVIPISNLKHNDWNKIQLTTGLMLEVIKLTIEYEVKPEREQKDRYLTHFRKLLQISKYKKLEIYNASKNNNFLSMSADILPTRLIALAELTASDLKSKHTVLIVLTDLKNDWQFFCFENRRDVTFTLPRGKAVALIQKNMKFSNCEQTIEIAEEPKRTKLE
ncbi:37685_t:CDS:2, partial [Gigaspora margarita]